MEAFFLTGNIYRRDRPLLGGTGKAIAFIGSDPGTGGT
jgi:hypothetical protein